MPFSYHAARPGRKTPRSPRPLLRLPPSADADAGERLFFVAVARDGRTASAATSAEHEQNIALAHKNGVLRLG
ncbi:hypothetical protein [Segniliparus rugosus]|uniref:hypothetical protein n=1 Tax=Segniliparus rugosus TaxID=286804 RepID=UPI0001F03A03|nr:hypothetical protein [Segniliparus rugosus]